MPLDLNVPGIVTELNIPCLEKIVPYKDSLVLFISHSQQIFVPKELLATPTSVTEQTGTFDVKLTASPNPATELLTLSSKDEDLSIVNISVYTIQGQLRGDYAFKNSSPKVTIPVNELITGVYVVHTIFSNGTDSRLKVLVVR